MDRILPERTEKSEIIDILNWIDRIKFTARQVFEAELKGTREPKMEVFLSERHMKLIEAANALQGNVIEMVQRIRILKMKESEATLKA